MRIRCRPLPDAQLAIFAPQDQTVRLSGGYPTNAGRSQRLL